jgi:hypothetical protein
MPALFLVSATVRVARALHSRRAALVADGLASLSNPADAQPGLAPQEEFPTDGDRIRSAFIAPVRASSSMTLSTKT